jgi:hypothetical protein
VRGASSSSSSSSLACMRSRMLPPCCCRRRRAEPPMQVPRRAPPRTNPGALGRRSLQGGCRWSRLPLLRAAAECTRTPVCGRGEATPLLRSVCVCRFLLGAASRRQVATPSQASWRGRCVALLLQHPWCSAQHVCRVLRRYAHTHTRSAAASSQVSAAPCVPADCAPSPHVCVCVPVCVCQQGAAQCVCVSLSVCVSKVRRRNASA